MKRRTFMQSVAGGAMTLARYRPNLNHAPRLLALTHRVELLFSRTIQARR